MVGFTDFNPAINLKAGADFANTVFKAEQQQRQYNALRQMFGDAVGPDDTLPQLDANRRQNQKLPGELENQTLTNQGLKQTNAFNELNNPVKLQQNQADLTRTQQGNAYDAQTMGSRVQQSQNTATQGQQQAELNKQKIDKGATEAEDAATEKSRNAALGITAAAKARIAAGEDPASVWNNIAPQVAAMEGVDPGQLDQLKRMFIADPQKTIDLVEQHANATRPNTALMRGQAALMQGEAAKQRAAAAAAGKSGKVDPADAASALEASKTMLDANIDNIDRLVGTAEKPGAVRRGMASSGIGRTIQEHLAEKGVNYGTESYSVHKDIESIKHAISLTDLKALKDMGVSLGRVTNVEFEAASKAYETLDPREDVAATERKLTTIRNFLNAVRGTRQQQADKMRDKAGLPPREQTTAPDANAAAQRKALLDKYR